MTSQSSALLSEQIVAALSRVIGEDLAAIDLGVVPGELAPDWSAASSVLVGYGPTLCFQGGAIASFSARERGGWVSHFTLSASSSPFVPNPHLTVLPASSSALAAPLIGHRLDAASVRGWGRCPHQAVLSFGALVLVIANGTATDPGATDDVFASTRPAGHVTVAPPPTLGLPPWGLTRRAVDSHSFAVLATDAHG